MDADSHKGSPLDRKLGQTKLALQEYVYVAMASNGFMQFEPEGIN